MSIVTFGCLLNILPLAPICEADTVHLKNGRTIEGIVSKETDSEVVLDLGVGAMTIPRSTVASIEYSDDAERAKLAEEWRRRYYLHPRYVPTGLQPLVDALRTAEAKRDAAVRAERAARQEESVAKTIRESIVSDQKKLSELSREVERAGQGMDPAEYNELVRKVNAVQAGLLVKQHELEAVEEREKQSIQTVNEYMRSLDSLETILREASQVRRTGADAAAVGYFLAKVGERLRELKRDVQETSQPVREEGGATVVTAIVNGTHQGEFILDTGAGLMSVSESFAQRARLDLDAAPETDLVMADGRRIRGKTVILRSVRVGDAIVYHVPAVVMPMTLRGRIDGLLGMSFLQHFNVSMSPGMVTLRQFRPK